MCYVEIVFCEVWCVMLGVWRVSSVIPGPWRVSRCLSSQNTDTGAGNTSNHTGSVLQRAATLHYPKHWMSRDQRSLGSLGSAAWCMGATLPRLSPLPRPRARHWATPGPETTPGPGATTLQEALKSKQKRYIFNNKKVDQVDQEDQAALHRGTIGPCFKTRDISYISYICFFFI